jgi:hypothetical protein
VYSTRTRSLLAVIALLTMGTVPGLAHAATIGAGAFGSEASVESFEGLEPGPNVTLFPGTGQFEPGVIADYTFASGVTLTTPIPNPGLAGGVFVGDFSIGSAEFGLGSNGIITAADVPFGSAYMALNNTSSAQPYIEFTFASDMFRVGAYVTGPAAGEGGSAGFVTMEVFDGFGTLLESTTIANVNVTSWSNNFIGIERAEGIQMVRFSDSFEALDGVTFEAIPEPNTALLLASGLVAMAAGRRRRA